MNSPPVDPLLDARFPHKYWSFAAKKGYCPSESILVLSYWLIVISPAGTAILSKLKPLNVTYTLPGHPEPEEVKGRIITLEFENTWVVGTYVPNAGEKLKVCNMILYSPVAYCVADSRGEGGMEQAFWSLHSPTWHYEACNVDGWPERSSYRTRFDLLLISS
jgi:hypothetical protein